NDGKRADGWSIADLFIEVIESRAVLGMHGAVRGETAGKLAGALYRALIKGESLDMALSEACRDADTRKGSDPQREWDWAQPYLRLRVPPEDVLPVAFVPEQWREVIDDARIFEKNLLFLNRAHERDDLMKLLRGDSKSTRNVVLVEGEGKIGKTRLICWC